MTRHASLRSLDYADVMRAMTLNEREAAKLAYPLAVHTLLAALLNAEDDSTDIYHVPEVNGRPLNPRDVDGATVASVPGLVVRTFELDARVKLRKERAVVVASTNSHVQTWLSHWERRNRRFVSHINVPRSASLRGYHVDRFAVVVTSTWEDLPTKMLEELKWFILGARTPVQFIGVPRVIESFLRSLFGEGPPVPPPFEIVGDRCRGGTYKEIAR